MKKILAALVISLAASSAFANMNLVKKDSLKLQEDQHWKFGKDDGITFLLGPESLNKVVIEVYKNLSNNLPADPITVSCNGTNNFLPAGQSITCYPSFADINWLAIPPQYYKNGSEGTLRYIPIKD